MKKSKYVLIVVLVFLMGIFYFFNSVELYDRREVCFSSNCVEIKIADSPSERERGLMFVSSLDEDDGMLFVFEESGEHGFWMKNTLIPLDIIWVNENFEVVDIKTAEPCEEEPCEVYIPIEKAKYVLEVNSDWVEKNGVKVGNFVEIVNL